MTKTERHRSHIRQEHADDRDAKGHSDNYHLGLYTGAQLDALRLSADLATFGSGARFHSVNAGVTVRF
ncbi:hypothetical protein [Pseudomonas putida]|uniref:hypothetical protein n=1 Tax=Pseudomonas putida TaxID=303 RepID=UPI00383AD997